MSTIPSAKEDQPHALVRPRVLVFFDYACPFCYLDWPRFTRLREEHDIELMLVPLELRPDLDLSGVSMDELGAGHSEHVEEHMQRMAADAGLPLAFPDTMPNTHAALAVGEYARDVDPETHERLHEAILESYNGHAVDIGRLDLLLDVAASAGLDVVDVRRAIEEGRFDERLHEFRRFAQSLGVTATPSALMCNEILIGSRPYEVLLDALSRCLVSEVDPRVES
jgi:predicted DsbA family dithiol-disulfide isomerase